MNPDNLGARLPTLMGDGLELRWLGAADLPALIEFAFGRLRLHRIGADTDPRNAASIRVLEKLGFRREGLRRECYFHMGEAQDALLFGLLQSDWAASGRRRG